nr:uncharacterized mitochondrial protein AtMg00810-like [Tanacetum cinerariifolium]
MKGILRQFSVAKTPQQNRVAKRRNMTLIEAARTMLADFKLPTTFWAEAVNTACYVQNRVLVVKPHNKTPYELFHGSGPDWLFDIDALTRTMNYEPIIAGTQSNDYEDLKSSHDDGSKPSSDDGKKMDVKSAFLYEKIEEEVYVCQPLGFEDPDFPDRVNKVQKALGKIDKTLFIKRHKEVKNTSTPMKTQKSLLKDEDGEEVDVHMYKSMIGSLIYLTSLRPDIMFAVCTCARYQVNLEVSHLHAVKRIFRYLKGQQKIGLWYTKDSPFDLIAYTDSDYAEASLDKKSTTGGCQFLGCRLISWQRKKQTVVANSITEAEYVAASSCCGQMDVKSAFLYEKIEEEVYVCQPLGFEDPDFPDRVNKVEKALYGLHQAPRAWYETLSTYLLDNGFQRGKIDKTLFIKRHKEVKNTSTPMKTQKSLLKDEDGEEVDVHMYKSMIGSLIYLTSSRPDIMFAVCTCARYQVNLEVSHLHAMKRIFRVDGKKVIISKASIRRDLQFADEEGVDCLLNSTFFEQLALIGNLDNLSGKFLTYLRFIQVFLDKQIDGISNPKRKYISPSHTKNFFGNMRRIGKGFSWRITPLFLTMVVESQLGEGSAMPTDPHYTPIILQSLSSQPQKTHKPRKPNRKDTQVPRLSVPTESVTDEAVYKELDDILVRAATTASSLEAEHNSDNINKTQSKATPNESSFQGTSSGGGPRGNTLQSDEDRMKLNELMELCANLQIRVTNLEKTKTTQANEIDSLKRGVKKLEMRNKSRTHKFKRLYKVSLNARVESLGDKQSLGEDASKQERRIDDIDADKAFSLVSVHNNADKDMFDADTDLGGEEVFGEQEVVADKEKINEVTLAQALAELKTSKPKVKGIVIQEPSESPTTTTTIPKQKSHDKSKGIIVKEPVKHKKKD